MSYRKILAEEASSVKHIITGFDRPIMHGIVKINKFLN